MKTQFTVTQYGQPLDPSKYIWDESTKTFRTTESYIVLDFSNVNDCTFYTASYCIFKTGSYCIFKTGVGCVFDTFNSCTFTTGVGCVIIRRDVFEVIKLFEDVNHIKLNCYDIGGYEVINETHTIIVDGKEVELSKDGYEAVKRLLK